jgi:hypothetical protein
MRKSEIKAKLYERFMFQVSRIRDVCQNYEKEIAKQVSSLAQEFGAPTALAFSALSDVTFKTPLAAKARCGRNKAADDMGLAGALDPGQEYPAHEEQPTVRRKRRRTKKAKASRRRPHKKEKMLPLAETRPLVLTALKHFKTGSKFKNVDVYQHVINSWRKSHQQTQQQAEKQVPYKGITLAMSTLKGVKRQKVKSPKGPPTIVYTAGRKMYF